MKKTFTTTLMTFLLCVCMVFGLAGCGTSQEEVDTTVNNAIAPVSEQITAINASLDDLKAVDAALDGYIDELYTKVEALESANDGANDDEISALKTAIQELQEKDTALESKITSLEATVATLASKDWANATFATLAQYSEIQSELAAIKTSLSGGAVGVADLTAAISASETSMKEWVNGELQKVYSDISALRIELEALAASAATDEELAAAVTAQQAALEQAKNDLTAAYEDAIEEAIEDNNGVIDDAIADGITAATNNLQKEIANIKSEIIYIQSRLDTLELKVEQNSDKIAELEAEIEEIKKQINCLKGNHTYTYTDNDDGSTHDALCSVCEIKTTEGHSFVDNFCTVCQTYSTYTYDASSNVYRLYKADGLKAVIEEASYTGTSMSPALIILMDDITVPQGTGEDWMFEERVEFNKGIVELDLNGKTLTTAIDLYVTAKLVIHDSSNGTGQIISSSTECLVGVAESGEFTVNGGILNSTAYSLGAVVGYGGHITVNGGKFVAESNAVYPQSSPLIITGGEFFGEHSALVFNTQTPSIYIMGGSFTGGGFDIETSGQTGFLSFNYGTGEGPRFPGGISIYNDNNTAYTLNPLLAAEAEYVDADGNPITISDDADSYEGNGDVVIKSKQ